MPRRACPVEYRFSESLFVWRTRVAIGRALLLQRTPSRALLVYCYDDLLRRTCYYDVLRRRLAATTDNEANTTNKTTNARHTHQHNTNTTQIQSKRKVNNKMKDKTQTHTTTNQTQTHKQHKNASNHSNKHNRNTHNKPQHAQHETRNTATGRRVRAIS